MSEVFRAFVENENIGSRIFKKPGLETRGQSKSALKDKNVIESASFMPKGKNIVAEIQRTEMDQVVETDVLIENVQCDELFYPEPVPDAFYDIIPHHLTLFQEDIRNVVFGFLVPSEEADTSTESLDVFDEKPDPPSWNPDLEYVPCELDEDLPPLPILD